MSPGFIESILIILNSYFNSVTMEMTRIRQVGKINDRITCTEMIIHGLNTGQESRTVESAKWGPGFWKD